MYRRLSDETFGIKMESPSGMFSTWKRVGVVANCHVGALVRDSRYSFTARARSIAKGIACSSVGETSPSHSTPRSMSLMNSWAPYRRWKYATDRGSSRRNRSFSSAVVNAGRADPGLGSGRHSQDAGRLTHQGRQNHPLQIPNLIA